LILRSDKKKKGPIISASANPKVSLAISFDALDGFNLPAKVIVKLTIPKLLMPKSRVEITNTLKFSKNTVNKRDKACIIIAENNAKNMDALFST